MTKEIKTKMEQEIQHFSQQFFESYGHTPAREKYFTEALPKFANKVLEKGIDLEKELWNFIDEYKNRQLGGFNATYGRIYHWLIDFAAIILGVDAFELRSSVVYK
jgi:hypothetical protein